MINRYFGRQAFSLVELLVVIAIIVLLATFIVPAFNSIFGANSIVASADRLAGTLNLGRQAAVTKNRKIEVRFYETPDEPATNDFRMFQLFEIDDSGGAKPMGKAEVLPTSIVMARDTGLSTVLAGTKKKTNWSPSDPQISVPRAGTSYECRAFQFRPDGSTDLNLSLKWHITVVDARLPGSATQPPKNFATVWIEPFSGAIRVLRP